MKKEVRFSKLQLQFSAMACLVILLVFFPARFQKQVNTSTEVWMQYKKKNNPKILVKKKFI